MTSLSARLTALSNPSRLDIVAWLRAPGEHFPPQVHADIETVGVCGSFIADKLAVSGPTASAHLKILVSAGLVSARRIGKWTYYRRDEQALQALGLDLAGL